eukprot:6173200-Pleurochrysis_carterae.AAC.5
MRIRSRRQTAAAMKKDRPPQGAPKDNGKLMAVEMGAKMTKVDKERKAKYSRGEGNTTKYVYAWNEQHWRCDVDTNTLPHAHRLPLAATTCGRSGCLLLPYPSPT